MRGCFYALVLLVLLVSADSTQAIFGGKQCRVNLMTFDRPQAGPIRISSEEEKFSIAGTESNLLEASIGNNLVSILSSLEIPSNLHIDGAFTSNGVPQWKLWSLDTFDKDDGLWYPSAFTTCGGSIDLFLGGHCKFAGVETSRLYEHLPSHKTVRITARVHYIDQWSGQSVYLKHDGTIVWTGSWNWCPRLRSLSCTKLGVDVCGHQYPDSLSTMVDVQFPHTGGSLSLIFGSTIDKDADPCVVSWGVDDVAVYLF